MSIFSYNGIKRACIHCLGLLVMSCLLFSPLVAQEYAFMYIANGTGTNSVGTTWTNVGAGTADDFVESVTSTYWSYANNVLTAGNNVAVEGDYCIKYSLSFNADATIWYIGISIDGAAPVEPVFTRTISNDRKDAGNISGILITSITQGQTVELVVKSDLAVSDFTPVYAQLSLFPAAQNSETLYSGMHINSSTTYSNLGTSFAKLTGFSSVSEINGWTFGSSDLTADIGSDGLYYMSYSVSFTGDGTPTSPGKFTFELLNNGVNGSTNIIANRSTSSDDMGNISAGGLVSITAGDVISLEAKASNSTYDLAIEKATLSLFKLGDTTPNAYGGMIITTDQTVTISAQNTWTTVGNYTLSSSDMWELNSNIFTLTSTNAYGYYYLEFSTALSTANTGGDDIKLGVFIGNTLNSALTVTRRLSDNTDIGMVCGVGLFKVDGPDSTITLKINNTTSINDITIKKSKMGFSQIRYVASDTPLPITLDHFEAFASKGKVMLNWETASETENLGFNIYRKADQGLFELLASYADAVELVGQGTTAETNQYHYVDETIEAGKHYQYLLADMSCHMEEIRHTDFIRNVYLPVGLTVGEAFPNPFNPQCTVSYEIDLNEHISIDLMDITGKTLKTLVDMEQQSGQYSLTINEPSLSTGLYLLRIHAGDQIEFKKLMLMK